LSKLIIYYNDYNCLNEYLYKKLIEQEKLLENQKQLLDKKQQEIDQLKQNQNNVIVNNVHDNINNINNVNNTINININNVIHPLGEEDTKHITPAVLRNCLVYGADSAISLILEDIHGNVKYPRNHNMYISNMRKDEVIVLMNDNQVNKWTIVTLFKILPRIIKTAVDLIDKHQDAIVRSNYGHMNTEENLAYQTLRVILHADNDKTLVKDHAKVIKKMLHTCKQYAPTDIKKPTLEKIKNDTT